MVSLSKEGASSRIIRFHRYFGRYGVMVSTENERDHYGQIGSKGVSFHLVVWKDPRGQG